MTGSVDTGSREENASNQEIELPPPSPPCRWLTPGSAGVSNPSHAAAASLKFEAYWFSQPTKDGETMTTHSVRSKHLYSERAEKIHDLLLLSSFGLWAVLLGLSPVLAFHMLMAS
jgi:hypothetical protein